MANQWTWRESVDELELEELESLADQGRPRKSSRKKSPIKATDEIAVDEREDKRRKRRWEAPPHKRVTDYEPG